MQKPYLYDYLSPYLYLNDLYIFYKKTHAGFSFESWSVELGFKSRSYMKMILAEKRNLTLHFIEVFSRSMNLTSIEKTYFSFITNYHSCDNDEEKNYYLEKIYEIQKRSKETVFISDHEKFLSQPLIPLILILLSFKDVEKTVKNISHFLNENEEIVHQCLLVLKSLNLALEIDQQWKATHESFYIPASLNNQVLADYHRQSLQQAIEAQNLPKDQRRFRSLLMSLSEQDYENLLKDIEMLVIKLTNKYDSAVLQNKKIYKLNINFFPMTQKYDVNKTDLKPENETRLCESESR